MLEAFLYTLLYGVPLAVLLIAWNMYNEAGKHLRAARDHLDKSQQLANAAVAIARGDIDDAVRIIDALERAGKRGLW